MNKQQMNRMRDFVNGMSEEDFERLKAGLSAKFMWEHYFHYPLSDEDVKLLFYYAMDREIAGWRV